jgi:hypothetical protein
MRCKDIIYLDGKFRPITDKIYFDEGGYYTYAYNIRNFPLKINELDYYCKHDIFYFQRIDI